MQIVHVKKAGLGLCFIFSFICTQAQAIVILENPAQSYESQKRASHQEALKHSGVCRVSHVFRNPKGQEVRDSYSGAFFRNQNGIGYILSSAHSLKGTKSYRRVETLVSFGDLGDSKEDAIVVDQVIVHPKFEEVPVEGEKGCQLSRNDLAILTFDANQLSPDIEPFALYDGEGYKSGLHLEALIVGYGDFGLNTSSTLEDRNFHAYAGYTYVQFFPQFEAIKAPAFINYLSPLNQPMRPHATPTDFSVFTFASQINPSYHQLTADIKMHSKQAILANGDSGSPLLFQTRHGLKLAGIGNSGSISGGELTTGDYFFKLLKVWEPLPPHRGWIESVIGEQSATDNKRRKTD